MLTSPRTPLVCLGLSLLIAGCGRTEPPSASVDRFVPPADLARTAVDVVLASWKSGLPVDPEGRLPARVHVIDKHRKPGQVLVDFEILGPAPGDAKRCFAVRLTLSEPEEELRVRYAVVGIDPLMVFRHEDLDDLAHWDGCSPADEQEESSPASRGPPAETETAAAGEEGPPSAPTQPRSLGNGAVQAVGANFGEEGE